MLSCLIHLHLLQSGTLVLCPDFAACAVAANLDRRIRLVSGETHPDRFISFLVCELTAGGVRLHLQKTRPRHCLLDGVV